MHILYISQYFPPETGAAQSRAYEMSRNLVKLGNRVTVVTGFPNYPRGEIYTGYRGELYRREKMEGLEVVRTCLFPDPKNGSIKRIFSYGTFFMTSIMGALGVKEVDLVYASSPPLSVGLAGYLVSKLKAAKFCIEVRDLWVDFAVSLEKLNSSFLIRMIRGLEKIIYKKADKIITVTNGFKDNLVTRGYRKEKVRVITNGFEGTVFSPGLRKNKISEKYCLHDKFVVMYAGNLGLAQGLDFLIEAAEKTKEKSDIIYLLVGTGADKEKLKKKAIKKKLNNIIFVDNQPRHKIPDFLSAADALLISLKDLPLFDITIPSKVFDYLAMGKPILIGVKGEARNIIEDAEAGFYFKPGDADDFVCKLNKIYSNPKLRKEMSKNARNYALNNFRVKNLCKKLNKILQQLNEGGVNR